MTSHSFSAPKAQARKEQEALLRELLEVLDTLDQAQAHWQDAAAACLETPSVQVDPGPLEWLRRLWSPPVNVTADPQLQEVISSGGEGIQLIRQTLLEVLRRRQVTPISALGQPFDPETMYALDRQPTATQPAMTVVQEVVRGYRWGDRVLREAQVIVAAELEQGD